MDKVLRNQPRLFIEPYGDKLIIGCGCGVELVASNDAVSPSPPCLNVFAQSTYEHATTDCYARGARFFKESADAVLFFSPSSLAVASRSELEAGGSLPFERVTHLRGRIHDVALLGDMKAAILLADRVLLCSVMMKKKHLRVEQLQSHIFAMESETCVSGCIVVHDSRRFSCLSLIERTGACDGKIAALVHTSYQDGEVISRVYDDIHSVKVGNTEWTSSSPIWLSARDFDGKLEMTVGLTAFETAPWTKKVRGIVVRYTRNDAHELIVANQHAFDTKEDCAVVGTSNADWPAVVFADAFDTRPAAIHDDMQYFAVKGALCGSPLRSSETILPRLHLGDETITAIRVVDEQMIVGCVSGRLLAVDLPHLQNAVSTELHTLECPFGFQWLHFETAGRLVAACRREQTLYCLPFENPSASMKFHPSQLYTVMNRDQLVKYAYTPKMGYVMSNAKGMTLAFHHAKSIAQIAENKMSIFPITCPPAIGDVQILGLFVLGEDIIVQDVRFRFRMHKLIRGNMNMSELTPVEGFSHKITKACRVSRAAPSWSHLVLLTEDHTLHHIGYKVNAHGELDIDDLDDVLEDVADVCITKDKVLVSVTSLGIIRYSRLDLTCRGLVYKDNCVDLFALWEERETRRVLGLHRETMTHEKLFLVTQRERMVELWDVSREARCRVALAPLAPSVATFSYALTATPTHVHIAFAPDAPSTALPPAASDAPAACSVFHHTIAVPTIYSQGTASLSYAHVKHAGVVQGEATFSIHRRIMRIYVNGEPINDVLLPKDGPCIERNVHCAADAVPWAFIEILQGSDMHMVYYCTSPRFLHCVPLSVHTPESSSGLLRDRNVRVASDIIGIEFDAAANVCFVRTNDGVYLFKGGEKLAFIRAPEKHPLEQVVGLSEKGSDGVSLVARDAAGAVWLHRAGSIGWKPVDIANNKSACVASLDPLRVDVSRLQRFSVGMTSGQVLVMSSEGRAEGRIDYHRAAIRAMCLFANGECVAAIDSHLPQAAIHARGESVDGVHQYTLLACVALGCPVIDTRFLFRLDAFSILKIVGVTRVGGSYETQLCECGWQAVQERLRDALETCRAGPIAMIIDDRLAWHFHAFMKNKTEAQG